LAKNKRVQDKLRAELSHVDDLSIENISKLPYLDQVFSENIRLHPILTVLNRKCTQSTTLVASNGQSVYVEKGCTVVIPFYSVHTDERYYEDPLSFDPDRFDPEKGGTKEYKQKGVYLPFGDGPRKCLGMRFGTAQVKRGLCEVIKNFEVSLNGRTCEPINFLPGHSQIHIPENVWLDFRPL
jgi:cytochrome P450 family 6/cytochrome P450 family 28